MVCLAHIDSEKHCVSQFEQMVAALEAAVGEPCDELELCLCGGFQVPARVLLCCLLLVLLPCAGHLLGLVYSDRRIDSRRIFVSFSLTVAHCHVLQTTPSADEEEPHSSPKAGGISRALLISIQASHTRFVCNVACIGASNTSQDFQGRRGVTGPVHTGAAVDAATGDFYPCSFEDKGPELALRGARCFTGAPELWNLTTTINHNRCLEVGPFAYKAFPHAGAMIRLAEDDPQRFLAFSSTSPQCEASDYIPCTVAVFRFLEKNPDWRACFQGAGSHADERCRSLYPNPCVLIDGVVTLHRGRAGNHLRNRRGRFLAAMRRAAVRPAWRGVVAGPRQCVPARRGSVGPGSSRINSVNELRRTVMDLAGYVV